MQKKQKKKVLCVCFYGRNRSRYLANYLRRKGYITRYGGLELDKKDPNNQNFVSQEEADWADVIIFVKPSIERKFKDKYNFKKKIITIKVTDVKELIPEEYADLRKLSNKEFQKKWTYTQLRRAIKPFLPL